MAIRFKCSGFQKSEEGWLKGGEVFLKPFGVGTAREPEALGPRPLPLGGCAFMAGLWPDTGRQHGSREPGSGLPVWCGGYGCGSMGLGGRDFELKPPLPRAWPFRRMALAELSLTLF